MNHEQIITATVNFVKTALEGAEGGHDWWHIYRVWQQARHIAAKETVNGLVVELGALLHDIADSKFHNGDESIGPAKAVAFLQTLAVPTEVITHVENIIRHISFKGGNQEKRFIRRNWPWYRMPIGSMPSALSVLQGLSITAVSKTGRCMIRR